jgi:hypothetical protein
MSRKPRRETDPVLALQTVCLRRDRGRCRIAGDGFQPLDAVLPRHVERRVGQELDTHLNQLIGGLRIDAQGLSLLREPVDPRFQAVFGGLYWQVNDITAGRFCGRVRFGTPILRFRAMC